jgi:putative hydrolase of the HAD superfamily
MTRTTTIQAILFDVGGVLIALDGVPTMARLLGLDPSQEVVYQRWMTSASVIAYETGKIGAEEFAAGVVADLSLTISPEAFLADFCSWPGALLPGALDVLDAIPRHYRVAALSNTSAVHWERIAATGLATRFERVFLSHEIGHLKPSPDAFHHALDGLDLPASAVLFLDDNARNVAAAAALGMPAQLARNPAEARAALVDHGIVL